MLQKRSAELMKRRRGAKPDKPDQPSSHTQMHQEQNQQQQFAQKQFRCHCCGDPNHPAYKCPKKNTIDKKDWLSTKLSATLPILRLLMICPGLLEHQTRAGVKLTTKVKTKTKLVKTVMKMD